MQPVVKVRNVIRSLKQAWGTSRMKGRLWDREYASGRWDDCDRSPGARVYSYVEKYAANGSILDLGCGSGNTANELNLESYRDYTGVDISGVALAKAAARSKAEGRGEKNRFVEGDIATWVPPQKYDAILFRESIYYVPQPRIKAVLEHYMSYLTETGVLIVNVGPYGTRRSPQILELIEQHYQPVEKYAPAGSNEFIVVLRRNQSGSK